MTVFPHFLINVGSLTQMPVVLKYSRQQPNAMDIFPFNSSLEDVKPQSALEQVLLIKIAYLPNLDSPQVLFLFIVVFFQQLFWLPSCLHKQNLHVVYDGELALHLEEITFNKN